MKNKTCGECKHFKDAGFKDPCEWVHATFDACFEFEPKQRLTNSEKIRQMNDGTFAYMMTRLILDGCPISKSKTLEEMHECKISNDCTNCLKQWLNSPAESEVER